MRTLGTPAKIGYWLCVILGVLDLSSLLLTPSPGAGEEGPPLEVLIFDSVMGLITVAAAVWVFRSGARNGVRIMAASRILSAITALPAFFVADVPPQLVALGAGGVVVTIVAVVLLMSRSRANGAPRTTESKQRSTAR